MAQKFIPPQLGRESYSCPHCGAIAHQNWFRVFAVRLPREVNVSTLTRAEIDRFDPSKVDDDQSRGHIVHFIERFEKNALTYRTVRHSVSADWEMVNLFFSLCYSCDGFAIWFEDRLLYPNLDNEIVAHDDMPVAVKRDFEEAASIVETSPRGAAALLRLAIQTLMVELKLPGKNLNEDIGALVKKGLDPRIHKALDVVRVIGNNAVHPGEIDLKDDKATALELFALVNLIVETMISVPKRVEEMYGDLPTGALEAIEKRDGPK